MSMSSNIGIKIEKFKNLSNKIEFFGEDQGRYVLEIDLKKFE